MWVPLFLPSDGLRGKRLGWGWGIRGRVVALIPQSDRPDGQSLQAEMEFHWLQHMRVESRDRCLKYVCKIFIFLQHVIDVTTATS